MKARIAKWWEEKDRDGQGCAIILAVIAGFLLVVGILLGWAFLLLWNAAQH